MSRPRKVPPPRQSVTVEIAGERHVLRSDMPPEYTRAVAQHVDDTLRALPSFPTLEPFRAEAVSLTGRADFRTGKKQLAFGGKNAGKTKVAEGDQAVSSVALLP